AAPGITVRSEDAASQQRPQQVIHVAVLRETVALIDQDFAHFVRVVDDERVVPRRPDPAHLHAVGGGSELLQQRIPAAPQAPQPPQRLPAALDRFGIHGAKLVHARRNYASGRWSRPPAYSIE